MTEKKRVPAIRFKGFTEDWEQRKVSNMFKVTRGYVLAATKTVANQTNDMPYPVYSSQTLSNGLLGFYNEYLYKDAITWTTDGANAGTVNYRIGKFYCTNVCGVLLSDKVKASQMIAESLNSVAKKYVSYVGNPKLMNNVMADIMINIPIALKEQEQISGLFTIVDTLITLHQRKVDSLKNVKQSMLTKMFPVEGETKPAIRFKGFTEDWEQRKLGDIARMHARIGWQNLRTSEFLDQGDYYLITGTDFDNGEIDFAHCHYVGKDRFDQDKNIQLQIGSILVTKDGTLGKIAYVKELDKPATLNAGVFNVLINDELDIDRVYLFQYLKAPFLMDFVEKGATGGTIKHLNQGLLVNFPINISSYGEQQRIGRFFSDLDTLITLHQRVCIIFLR